MGALEHGATPALTRRESLASASGYGSAAESDRMGASEHGAAPALTRSSGDSAANESVGAAESLAPVADLALVDIISSLSENDNPEAIEIRTAAQGVRDVRGRDRQTLLRRLASRSDQIHIRETLAGEVEGPQAH